MTDSKLNIYLSVKPLAIPLDWMVNLPNKKKCWCILNKHTKKKKISQVRFKIGLILKNESYLGLLELR